MSLSSLRVNNLDSDSINMLRLRSMRGSVVSAAVLDWSVSSIALSIALSTAIDAYATFVDLCESTNIK